LKQLAAEERDLEVEKLRKKFAPKLAALQERLRRAEVALEKEKSQASQQTLNTMLNVGTTVLGALFGRKMASATNLSRAASSVRSASKIAKERGDIGHAKDSVESVQQQISELESDFSAETERLREQFDDGQLAIQELPIAPRKSDMAIDKVALAWTPWLVSASGTSQAAFET
jgi:hypothetical protein